MQKKLNVCVCVVIDILFLVLGASAAQEKSDPPQAPASSTTTEFPAAKQQVTRANAEAEDKPGSKESGNDGPEKLRKRAEWFYKQRASVKGHIPAGARVRAFQHMQQMMVAEGKLVRRADGSFAAVVSPETNASSFPAWTSIGPTPTTGGTFSPVTGRITTIAVDPSDASGNTVLIGGAQGGIWRSTDAGATWTPVGDQNASLSMGSIAFAPSNPSIVYAGTGEQESIAFDVYYGAGVLKSSDHGVTWTQTCSVPSSTCPFIGPYNDVTPFGYFTLGGTRISYVAVNPANPQMVLAGAQTQLAEGPTEGVYCSDNGGSTWTNILPDQMSTFVGFASSTVAYAALGNPFGSSPNAPNGNGIFKATSIGSTCSTIHFTLLTSGTLPSQSAMGRIDIGIAASDSSGNTLYASIADASTSSSTNIGVFLSSNGGSTWMSTNAPDVCQNQCWYDNVIKVDPAHSGTVFFGGSAVTDSNGVPQWVVRSTNSGSSWASVIPNSSVGNAGLPHVDNHAMALVKLSAGKVRLYLGNDGGIWRTDDAEASAIQWTNLNNSSLTLTQFYPAISIHPSTPLFSIAGTQDNGTQEYAGAPGWTDIGICGDGTGTAMDFLVPSSVYVACNGDLIGASYQNGAAGTFVQAVNGINSSDFLNFVPPFTADPNSANTLYLGTTKIYQSVDAANSWVPISGDLVSGGNFESLTAIAVAPGAPGVIYAGSTTGNLFFATGVTPGSSGNFTPVAITPRAITSIAIDPADVTGGTVYVASSGFSYVNSSANVNDPMGHVFKRAGFASPWIDVSCSVANCSKPAATDLPNLPVNDIVVDPDVPGTLYAATDLGVFIGNCSLTPCTWTTLSSGLPRVAVLSLKLHEPSRTLRAATHGRGAWDLHLNNFSFSGPHISSITPVSVNAGGTQFTLTVNGSGLTGGAIQFGSTALTATGTSSDSSLSGIVPSSLLTAGTVQITVKVASAASNGLPFPVLALTPTLTSVTPSSTPVQASPSSNVTIQLTGTNFAGNAKVFFNRTQNGIIVAAPSSSCPLPTCLKATLPAALLGPYGSSNDITVLDPPPGGGWSLAKRFQVAALAPPNDNIANAINITTLSFGDTQDSSGATTETTDPIPPCVAQFSNANGNTGGHPNGLYNTIWYKFVPQFSANLSLDTIGSSYDTVLSVWSGNPGSLANFACNDDINPGVVIQSQLSNVPLTAGTTYYIMVSSFGPPDPNPIALGGRSQFNFSYNSGNYPSPTLTSVSPTTANSGDPAFTLTLNGTNFFSGAVVDFVNSSTSYGNGLTTTYISPTQLTASVPASAIALPGSYYISVVNPAPNFPFSNSLNFTIKVGTYPVPVLGSISPSTVIAGSVPFSLVAACENCASTAVLSFNGVPKASFVSNSFSSPFQQNVSATISSADIGTPGTVQVTVSNPAPGGGPSAPLPFVITQPTVVPAITSLTPASLPANTPAQLTINGTGFVQGAALDVVGVGGGYWSTNFVSSTQLTIPNFNVGAVGVVPVYVVDPPPAGTSAAFNFTVTQPPPPTITSISPTTAASGSAPTLTITGTGFQFGANVLFGNVSYPATITSSTQLTVAVSLGGVTAGSYPVSVVDPAPAGASGPVNFTVTGPPDFSITSTGTTSVTVVAGSTATFTNAIVIAGQGGFSSTVALSCSTPSNATYTLCSISPSSFASGSGTATVSVTTMARGLVPPASPFRYFYPRPYLAPAVTSIMLALLWGFARTRRRRLALSMPIAGLALFVALQIIGCGGGGGSTPPPTTGTPAGSYMVTVTATSGSLSHTSTLTLVVQ